MRASGRFKNYNRDHVRPRDVRIYAQTSENVRACQFLRRDSVFRERATGGLSPSVRDRVEQCAECRCTHGEGRVARNGERRHWGDSLHAATSCDRAFSESDVNVNPALYGSPSRVHSAAVVTISD